MRKNSLLWALLRSALRLSRFMRLSVFLVCNCFCFLRTALRSAFSCLRCSFHFFRAALRCNLPVGGVFVLLLPPPSGLSCAINLAPEKRNKKKNTASAFPMIGLFFTIRQRYKRLLSLLIS